MFYFSLATCDAKQLNPCLSALTFNLHPPPQCCERLNQQKPCFCQYVKNPKLKDYLVNSAAAKKVYELCKPKWVEADVRSAEPSRGLIYLQERGPKNLKNSAAGHPVSGDGHPVGGGDICGDGQGQVGDELGPKHPPSSYADPYQIYTSIYESGILCGSRLISIHQRSKGRRLPPSPPLLPDSLRWPTRRRNRRRMKLNQPPPKLLHRLGETKVADLLANQPPTTPLPLLLCFADKTESPELVVVGGCLAGDLLLLSSFAINGSSPERTNRCCLLVANHRHPRRRPLNVEIPAAGYYHR
nr:non-specific lipid-transfer protein 2-like [Ipomoea batatas]